MTNFEGLEVAAGDVFDAVAARDESDEGLARIKAATEKLIALMPVSDAVANTFRIDEEATARGSSRIEILIHDDHNEHSEVGEIDLGVECCREFGFIGLEATLEDLSSIGMSFFDETSARSIYILTVLTIAGHIGVDTVEGEEEGE